MKVYYKTQGLKGLQGQSEKDARGARMISNIRKFRSSSYVILALALVFTAQTSHGLRGLDRGGHYDLEYRRPYTNYGTLFWRPQNVSEKYEFLVQGVSNLSKIVDGMLLRS